MISSIVLAISYISQQIEYNNLQTQCRGSSSGKSLVIESSRCNGVQYTSFIPTSRFELIKIGNDSFMNVDTFNIDGLNELKSLKIGMNSFTHFKSYDKWDPNKANNTNRSFQILNCTELESIEIGLYSFSDYGGEFELKNLPKLSIIKIGEIRSSSRNFYYSSFVIKGIIDINIDNEQIFLI